MLNENRWEGHADAREWAHKEAEAQRLYAEDQAKRKQQEEAAGDQPAASQGAN